MEQKAKLDEEIMKKEDENKLKEAHEKKEAESKRFKT
jgi:hypothetical protein